MKQFIPQKAKRISKRIWRNCFDTMRFNSIHKMAKKGGWKHIIIVCKGNICRSAFAEHYLIGRVNSLLKIESCGLDVIQEEAPPLNAIKAANRFGVDLALHKPKSFKACDFPRADLILAMEFCQYQSLVALFPEKKNNIHLLRKFAPGITGILCNIYDPYGLPLSDFDVCFRLLQKALIQLEKKI